MDQGQPFLQPIKNNNKNSYTSCMFTDLIRRLELCQSAVNMTDWLVVAAMVVVVVVEGVGAGRVSTVNSGYNEHLRDVILSLEYSKSP